MTVLDRSAIKAALRGPLGDTFNPDGPVYGTLLPRLTEALLKAQEEATQERDALANVNNAELVVYKHEAGITLVVQNAAWFHRLGGPEVGMQVKVLLRVPLDAEALTEIHRIMGHEGEL